MKRYALTLFCSGFLALSAAGQSPGADTTGIFTAARQAISRYEQISSSLEHLYNGPEYISYDRRLAGHAFFPSDSMRVGQVAYEGGTYTVPMLYDIVKDVLVVVHSSGYRLALHSDRVSQFSLENHSFVRLNSPDPAMPSGFYDVVYNGPTQLLVRRTKVILSTPTTTSVSNNGSFGQFDPKTKYYVRKNGQYVQVKNKRGLLTLLGDQRKQLVAYARKQQLGFRPSPEAAFLQLTQQYDALTKSL